MKIGSSGTGYLSSWPRDSPTVPILKKGEPLNSSNYRALMLPIIVTTIMMGCAYRSPSIQGPSIAAVSPQSVKAGGPTFTLTITGNHFTDNSTILWNGVALRTVTTSSSELRALVPAADIAVAGTALINVRYPNPESLPGLSVNATKAAYPRMPTEPIISAPGQSSLFDQTAAISFGITATTVSTPSITTASLPGSQVSQPITLRLPRVTVILPILGA